MQIQAPEGLAGIAGHKLLAIFEVMYLVAKADGFFAADEMRQFLKVATELSDGKLTSAHLSRLIDSWRKRENVDPQVRLSVLADTLDDGPLRRMAYDLAKQMAAADGQVLDTEFGVLRQVAEEFGIRDN